jgi:hypothetical protein
MLTWRTSTRKAIGSLHYLLSKTGPLTPADVAKILYIADKRHINDWGRVIYGENYFCGINGPVPEFVNNLITGNNHFDPQRDLIYKNICFENNMLKIAETSDIDYSCLSGTDKQSIADASLMVLTSPEDVYYSFYNDWSWVAAGFNSTIDGSGLISGDLPGREDFINDLKFNSKHIIF